MLTIQGLSYIHPDRRLLFNNINLAVASGEKIGLIGNNGSGKSTLLKIIASALAPSEGLLQVDGKVYYVPQIFGQYDDWTVAEALHIGDKINALKEILSGNISERNYHLLDDDWSIEERSVEALEAWQLSGFDLSQKMNTLSGGQKTKVFLAGISIHQPDLVLLDEPSNHLDISGKNILYDYISNSKQTLIVVSHDRKLLNLLDTIYELNQQGITAYGGNYDFYSEQKHIERLALSQNIHGKARMLRNAAIKQRETMERQQKLDRRGEAKQTKSGVARIMMNTLRNKAENSTAKLKNVHAEKMEALKKELQHLRDSLPETNKIKFGFDHSKLHHGKNIFMAKDINIRFENGRFLWDTNLNCQILSGERIAITGVNGSGKTTLIKIILGRLSPQTGTVSIAKNKSVYIDQDYALIDNNLKLYAQAQQFNTTSLQEHEIKLRLNRFLFRQEDWDKPVAALSGGEKMRLILCCLSIGQQAPDLIVLDEPTNNLDIHNLDILAGVISDYQGTLIVVSHDETFISQINIQRFIEL